MIPPAVVNCLSYLLARIIYQTNTLRALFPAFFPTILADVHRHRAELVTSLSKLMVVVALLAMMIPFEIRSGSSSSSSS